MLIDLYKKYFSKQPWVKKKIVHGQELIVDYNEAYKTSVLEKEKIEQEVAKKSSIPNLSVIHSGIDEDGRIKLELDWNDAFIKELNNNGFVGDSEEETVEKYLASIARESFESPSLPVPSEDYTLNDIQEPPIAKRRKRNILTKR